MLHISIPMSPSHESRMNAVRTRSLHELWFHTGTACNLECPFCLEDSKPGDTRLERTALGEIQPYIDEAVQLGVRRFCFTGGEPLIVKDIVKILSYALQFKPCLILSNGTAPLIKRAHQLQALKAQPQPLECRVSIDHPDEAAHDAQRGWGNFKRAIEGIKLLRDAGFVVSIACHAPLDGNATETAARFHALFAKHHLPPLPVFVLPELGRPGVGPASEPPNEAELQASTHSLMCAASRMILKRDGRLRVYACALTDDDPRFDLGPSLTASLSTPIPLLHRRCGQCVRCGVKLG